MADDSAVREPKTRKGTRLPNRQPDRLWGRAGVGLPCAVCGRSVSQNEMGLEVWFVRDSTARVLDQFHVHVGCFIAWEVQRHSA